MNIKADVYESQWENFSFTQGDIKDYDTCETITEDVDIILHQVALGSVPMFIA